MKTSSFRLLALLTAVLLALVFWPGARPAAARSPLRGPLPQIAFQTPTPGADGRILHIVQPGDTCTSISLLTGVPVEELRRLNNLPPECTLILNTPLLLGLAGPADPTATPGGPTAEPTPLLPSPTPFKGTGEVCMLLFEDANGDSMRQETEPAIAEGQVSLANQIGNISDTGTTSLDFDAIEDDYVPVCFSELPEGEYNISLAVPAGYNPTTTTNYVLDLRAGDQVRLNFGAQVSSAGQPTPEEASRSPMLGILGGMVLLVGVGLGAYLKFLRR